jgi:hypothetical protein
MGSTTDRDVMRSFEAISNRRVLVVLLFIAALLAVVIGVVVSGFRDRQISRGAAAVTESSRSAPATKAPGR